MVCTTYKRIISTALSAAFAILFAAVSATAKDPARIVIDPRGGDVSRQVKAEIAKTAKVQLNELMDFYEYGYGHPVWIVLAMDEKSFAEAAGDVPGWAVGIATRRRVVMRRKSADFGTQHFNLTLKHELSHVILAEMFAKSPPGSLPRWLDEGLAVYTSGEWEMPNQWESDKLELYSALRGGQALEFEEISASFPFSDWKARIAYAQSSNFTEYLVRKYGREKVVALLRALAAGKKLDAAFRTATGDGFSDVEYYWREKVAGRGGLTLLLIGITRFDEYLWTFMALLVVAGFVRYIFKRRAKTMDDGYLDDLGDNDDLREEWDEDTLGFRPWRPGR